LRGFHKQLGPQLRLKTCDTPPDCGRIKPQGFPCPCQAFGPRNGKKDTHIIPIHRPVHFAKMQD
jgi:hypothetical protein